jgi:hypothetical protein
MCSWHVSSQGPCGGAPPPPLLSLLCSTWLPHSFRLNFTHWSALLSAPSLLFQTLNSYSDHGFSQQRKTLNVFSIAFYKAHNMNVYRKVMSIRAHVSYPQVLDRFQDDSHRGLRPGGLNPASNCGGRCTISGRIMWDLWYTNSALGQVFSDCFWLPLPILIPSNAVDLSSARRTKWTQSHTTLRGQEKTKPTLLVVRGI